MAKLRDITGRKFRMLRVLHRHGSDSTGKVAWLCRCDCGRETVATGLNIKSGTTQSCGCLKRRPARRDLRGVRYGRLMAMAIAEVKNHKVWWRCQCDCGNSTVVSVAHLASGHTRSCGCLQSETSSVLAARNLGGKKEAHPRWRHDLTDAERYRQRTPADHRWSKFIVEREGHMCVVCYSTNSPHAHHLRAYATHPGDRLRLDNGVCLCAACHRHFHRQCGQRGSSRSDFFRQFAFPEPDECLPDSTDGHLLTSENIGNAMKYLWRAGLKGNAVEDLRKAVWYIEREIARLGAESATAAGGDGPSTPHAERADDDPPAAPPIVVIRVRSATQQERCLRCARGEN